MMQQQRYPPLPIMEADGSWREASTQCHVAPNCPRCASTNTKFCYYNNYSLAQPRYFCKACRRYWTKGGSLRNVPVGGGCRKNRRSRSRAHRNSPHNNSTAPDNSSSSSSSGQSSGPEIDMAAVFARYVSQDVAAGPKQDTCRLSDQAAWQEGSYDDLESFDYEMLVTDDVFWSTPSEAMAPLEELDSSPLFSSPSANDLLVSGANWSCPDLAGYGDFYTP